MIISAICLISSIVFAIVRAKSKYKSGRIFDSSNILFAGVTVSSVILFLPVYINTFGSNGCGVFETVLISIHNMIRLFIVDSEFEFVTSNLVGVTDLIYKGYTILFSILFVLAPILTFGFVLSFFKNISAYKRYVTHYNSDVFIFSEPNKREGNYHVLFNKNKSVIIAYPASSREVQYDIQDSVTIIDDCAFRGCTSLEKVIIPNSVTELGRGLFDGCEATVTVYCEEGSVIQDYSRLYQTEECFNRLSTIVNDVRAHKYSELNASDKLEVEPLLKIVKENNSKYLVEHTFGLEAPEDKCLSEICRLIVDTVNELQGRLPDIDYERVYCNLGNLKLLYKKGMPENAEVTADTVMHIIQIGCSCEEIENCIRRCSVSYRWSDFEINTGDFGWFFEDLAERYSVFSDNNTKAVNASMKWNDSEKNTFYLERTDYLGLNINSRVN